MVDRDADVLSDPHGVFFLHVAEGAGDLVEHHMEQLAHPPLSSNSIRRGRTSIAALPRSSNGLRQQGDIETRPDLTEPLSDQ
jgi:hypothetical protein